MPLRKLQLLAFCCLTITGIHARDQWILVGTYTGKGSNGIYIYRFNTGTGMLTAVDSIAVENPSYLAVSSNGKYVYSVTENGVDKPGAVSAFQFDAKTGHLKLLNEEPSGGDHPCYVTTNEKGDWVAVANYSGGNLSMLPVNKDGSLQSATQTIRHTGRSVVPGRQEMPHVHTVVFSPGEKYLVSADLGNDEVNAYPFNPANKKPLNKENAFTIKVAEGSGPRHLAFNASKPVIYILEELTGTVGVYHFSKENTSHIQTIASDTISKAPDKGSADIHLSPDGRFLYTSNRGQADNISIFSVHPETGELLKVGTQSVLGQQPRNFLIDPTGNYLLVANQRTNNIVVFKRNKNTGLLTVAGESLQIHTPVCLKFFPVN